MSDFLLYQQEEGIVTLTMNRPEDRNALSDEPQIREFVQVCERINADKEVRVVILTGAGPAFSSGGNIKDMRDKTGWSAGSPLQVRDAYRAVIQRLAPSLVNLEVPSIAAINGPAIGAGLDLACMCDIRIASDNAKFASSFVKLGIISGDGGTWLLSRIVSPAKALELMLTGDTYGADEARAIGLVSKVVPAGSLMEEARAYARRIASSPPTAVRLCKRLVRESQNVSLASALEMAAAFQALAYHTEDHGEAVRAFLEKRTPKFVGR